MTELKRVALLGNRRWYGEEDVDVPAQVANDKPFLLKTQPRTHKVFFAVFFSAHEVADFLYTVSLVRTRRKMPRVL